MADDGSQFPRIPPRLGNETRGWVPWLGELNRRTSDFSGNALERIETNERNISNIATILQRMSAYGGLAIDSPSLPYVGGPTVITNWDSAYPGLPAGDDALQVTLDPVAGTVVPDIDGMYLCNASISGDGSAGSLYTLDLYENSVRVIGFSVDQSNQSNEWTLSFSFILDLLAGAVLDLRLTAGGSTTVEHAVFSVTKTGLVASDIADLQRL